MMPHLLPSWLSTSPASVFLQIHWVFFPVVPPPPVSGIRSVLTHFCLCAGASCRSLTSFLCWLFRTRKWFWKRPSAQNYSHSNHDSGFTNFDSSSSTVSFTIYYWPKVICFQYEVLVLKFCLPDFPLNGSMRISITFSLLNDEESKFLIQASDHHAVPRYCKHIPHFYSSISTSSNFSAMMISTFYLYILHYSSIST